MHGSNLLKVQTTGGAKHQFAKRTINTKSSIFQNNNNYMVFRLGYF
jgi:hypothetical protein